MTEITARKTGNALGRRVGLLFTALWMGIAVLSPNTARAIAPDQLKALGEDDYDAKAAVVEQLADDGDATAERVLKALHDDTLFALPDGSLAVQVGDAYHDPLTDQAVQVKADDLSQVSLSNVLRARVAAALAGLQLRSADPGVRSRAVDALFSRPDPTVRKYVEAARQKETDSRLKGRLDQLWAMTALQDPDPQHRLEAVQLIGDRGDPQLRSILRPLATMDNASGDDVKVRDAAQAALHKLDRAQFLADMAGTAFTGLSLGSVLLLAALGLAITYGLIGVINMAHGEFLLIGAYTTYVVQNLFRAYCPGAFDFYPVVAVPAAFLLTALAGLVLERTLIRWLYGRPLETLLATFGISLLLMQAARTVFGAQNVQVENPSWMQGGISVLPSLILPYNRLVILAFAFAVVGVTSLILNRTRLGLYIRAVTQNRRMAACTGIVTWKIDAYAFAFGAGVAGLGGCALSQIGNVGPDLGQTYIIDSFMAVVLGGVGQLSGTIFGAMGLGLISKVLEPFWGAVLAKIFVLIFIILFIQKRPQGLFALKGRSVEA
ncbi:MAG TPA: urea ABC transporter permease subunit UrtB [Chthoniobacterales bacterium]